MPADYRGDMTEAPSPSVNGSSTRRFGPGCPRRGLPRHPTYFHLLAKPTGPICNLDCPYCFFLSKESLYPGDRFRMADDLLELYVAPAPRGARRRPTVTVAWQGGEPTLMGLDFFRRSVELVEQLPPPGQRRAHHPDQRHAARPTTGASLPAEHRFLVGVDGRAAGHARPVPGGQGRRRTLGQGARRPPAPPQHGVDVNILCTVNAGNQDRPLEVYRYFRDDLGATVHPVHPDRRARTNDTRACQEGGPRSTDRSVDPGALGPVPGRPCSTSGWRDVGTVFVQMFDAALASWVGVPPASASSPRRVATP